MKQINTHALYDLGKILQGFRTLPEDASKLDESNRISLIVGAFWMREFLGENLIPLEYASDAAQKLIQTATDISGRMSKGEKIESYELRLITQRLDAFETILSAELQKQLTFVVSQVGGYSMPLLVNKAEANLEEDAIAVIPPLAVRDFKEAGRCLAFDLPTACGIHTMRATEAVLRKYYKLVTGTDADANNLDWGTCIGDLKKSNADKKVVQLLDQIRDLHRNPLVHPQDFLDTKLALRLFDISKSAINALAEQIAIEEKRPRAQAASASSATP